MAEYFNYPKSLVGNPEQHYMLITSYESKNSVQNYGTPLSSIALYIPQDSLKTTIAQTYTGVAGGAVMATAGGGVACDKKGWIATMGENYGKASPSTTGAWESFKAGVSAFASKPQAAENFLSAGMGQARNKHMSLAYKGPGAFRTHDFTFNFFPQDQAEANIVKAILNDFKNGSTSRMATNIGKLTESSLSAPFFASPRQYKIKFMNGGKENIYLSAIGTSVITTLTINHDPSSAVGFHNDGSPVHSRLGITFQELEYITSADGKSEMGSGSRVKKIGFGDLTSHDDQIRERRG